MRTLRKTLLKASGLLGLICLATSWTVFAQDAEPADSRGGNDFVGTWYLALDSAPFGLPPGFPLSGLVQIHRDGLYQVLDGGDFGQATFTNTQHSQQFGSWRRDRRGRFVGSSLFLEADLQTGEVLRWQRVDIVLERTRDAGRLEGVANVSILECSNQLPIPTSLTCPDPVASAGRFVMIPPMDIPITLSRLRAR
jgi:hypothetical protein